MYKDSLYSSPVGPYIASIFTLLSSSGCVATAKYPAEKPSSESASSLAVTPPSVIKGRFVLPTKASSSWKGVF